jgi:hypothetical protein
VPLGVTEAREERLGQRYETVGGIQHERERIEKSRQLAAAALARLQTR